MLSVFQYDFLEMAMHPEDYTRAKTVVNGTIAMITSSKQNDPNQLGSLRIMRLMRLFKLLRLFRARKLFTR